MEEDVVNLMLMTIQIYNIYKWRKYNGNFLYVS